MWKEASGRKHELLDDDEEQGREAGMVEAKDG